MRWDIKTIALVVAFVLAPVIAIYLLDRDSAPNSGTLVTPPEEVIAPTAPIESALPQPVEKSDRPTVDHSTLSRPLELPKMEVIREQIARDPHQPPTAVLEFAKSLAPKMELAMRDEESAGSFFGTLEKCVLEGKEGQSLTSAKALCLTNADNLQKKFPSLNERYQQLYDAAPTPIQKLVR